MSVYVGIDVHRKHSQLAVIDARRRRPPSAPRSSLRATRRSPHGEALSSPDPDGTVMAPASRRSPNGWM